MRKRLYIILLFLIAILSIFGITAYYGLLPTSGNYAFVWGLLCFALLFGTGLGFMQLIIYARSGNKITHRVGLVSLVMIGLALILGAYPAGAAFELSANGCCGAAGGPPYGIVLGIVMVVAGLALVASQFRKY